MIGFFAPRILIPDWLFSKLTPAELEQVVLHEAEHLSRRDDWTNLLQKIALVLFPLNPALVWIERRLCREREMACDEGVVRRTEAPRDYAACLASLAERGMERRMELKIERRAHALSLGAFDRRPELVRRVSSLLARRPALHPMAARALVGVAACGLLAASVELARCPQMVEFVSAAHAATQQTRLARSDSSFRKVDTKAVLPSEHDVAASTPAASRRAVTSSTEPADKPQRELASTNANAPHEVFLRAEMPDADAGTAGQNAISAFVGEPQYFVLTTWEEVRTSHCASQVDFRLRYGCKCAAAICARPHIQPTAASQRTVITRITVTRLIFAVYPVGPAPGTKPAHAEDSGRPPAPLPESGWLVFQL